MLGICRKSGNTVIGTEQLCDAIRKDPSRIYLAVAACDVSENTKKRLSDKCSYYGVNLIFTPLTAAELGTAVGKRSLAAAVGITDAGLAEAVLKKS